MGKAQISKPIDPKLKHPKRCRNCNEWYEGYGARSTIWCNECSERRAERLVKADKERTQFLIEDARNHDFEAQELLDRRGIDWRQKEHE